MAGIILAVCAVAGLLVGIVIWYFMGDPIWISGSYMAGLAIAVVLLLMRKD